eukprot:TRINITY_DN59967_c0_g1_i1.p1 TRINITY_DN59967_c0_g1~~TRINITY_DN59967_c0_g1_i1.p1  ORF type:complete len:107 (+),score=2.80 TRINITY_DN59967_c0_g1_i1:89-409(+)
MFALHCCKNGKWLCRKLMYNVVLRLTRTMPPMIMRANLPFRTYGASDDLSNLSERSRLATHGCKLNSREACTAALGAKLPGETKSARRLACLHFTVAKTASGFVVN